MRVNKLLFLSMLSLFSIAVSAQNVRNYVSVDLGGGLSAFTYDMNIGDRKFNAAASAALEYQYRINWNWSIGVGAEVKMYSSSARFDTFSDSYTTAINPLSEASIDKFLFSYDYKDLEEQQKALFLNIPIYFQYRCNNGFYTRFGAKVGVPIKSKSEIYFEELATKGYFPHENVTYTNLPQHGFLTLHNQEVDVDTELKVNSSLMAELGWSWDWEERFVLYLGVQGEYGLNKLHKSAILKPQLVYNGGTLEYTPVWNATYDVSGERQSITNDKIKTFSVSLVVRYAFGW